MTRPDGIAASAIHIKRSCPDTASAAMSIAPKFGRRAANRLATAMRTTRTANPIDQSWVWSLSDSIGSITIG